MSSVRFVVLGALLALALLPSAAAADAGGLRYFGYFAARLTPSGGDHLAEVADRSNLNWVQISDVDRYIIPPPAPVPPASQPPSAPAPSGGAQRVVLPQRRVRVSRRGVLSPLVLCPPAASVACTGRLRRARQRAGVRLTLTAATPAGTTTRTLVAHLRGRG